MNTLLRKFSAAIRQWQKWGYPTTLVLVMGIVVVLFFIAARFLSTNINLAISSPDEAQIQAQLTHINRADYEAVEAKLHLPPLSSSEINASPTTTPLVATTTQQVPKQKSALTIAIFNSTKKAGSAALLKNNLTTAGFPVTTIGNTTPEATQTIVQIKQHEMNATTTEELLSLLHTRFTIDTPRILDEQSPYDIVITIGAR